MIIKESEWCLASLKFCRMRDDCSLLDNFLIENFLLLHRFLLFNRQSPEKLNLLLIGWSPLIVNFECRLEVLFNLDVESLRLDVYEWRIVHSWHCLSRN